MAIPINILSNDNPGPEVVQSNSTQENVRVVDGVIMCDPSSKEAPCPLDSGIGTESSLLLLLSAYYQLTIRILTESRSVPKMSRSQFSVEGSEALLIQVGNKMRHF